MLAGRESLVRLVGKRRTLPSNRVLLAPPHNDSTIHVERSLSVLEGNNGDPSSFTGKEESSAHGADLCRNEHAGKNGEEHYVLDWVTCPVCGRSVRGTDCMINAHLDECLARGNKRKLTQRTLFQLNFSTRPDNKTAFDESEDVKKQNRFNDKPEAKVTHLLPDFSLDDSGNDEYPSESCGKISLEHPIGQHSINIEMAEVDVCSVGEDMCLTTLETFIVGRKFCDEVEVKQEANVYVSRDPGNVKDPNAIKVLYVDSGQMLGYLPRELAKYLSPLIDQYCLKFEGSVTSLPRDSLDSVPICIACQEMLPCGNDPEDRQLIQSLWGNAVRAVEYAKKFPPNTKKYQQNFRILLQEVLKQNTHLFTDDEKLFLGSFESLSDDCQRLFLRLYTRKGPWFRISAVSYSEILDPQKAAEELCVAGYFCSWESSNKLSKEDVKELLNVLTVPELRGISSLALLKKNIRETRRQELIERLIAEYADGTILSLPSLILKRVGTCVRISSLADFLLWRIQRLFFLSGEQDLSAFLLADLGLVKYPDYKCNITCRIFPNRNDLLSYEEAIEVAQVMDQSLDENNMEMVMRCIEISAGNISNLPNNLANPFSISETAGAFLTRFSASWVYSKVVTLGISVLERERRYEDAVSLLKKLLSGITCDRRRGYWKLRLSIDLEHMGYINESLSVAEEGVLDPWVRAGSKIALQRRVLRLGKPPRRWKIPSFSSTIKRKIKEVHVRGTPLNSGLGMKNRYYGTDGEQCGVEQLALQYYAGEGGGGWQGVHSESGIWMTIFGLLMWDVIFADVPDVFRTRFQTAPLDLGTDSFYLSRRSLIEPHLNKIHEGMAKSMLVTSWEAHMGTSCRCVNWDRHSLPDLQDAVSCIGGPHLATLCRLLAEDYRSWSSGMPDLLLWRFSDNGGEAKLVEVKGPRDRLSEQQHAWLLVLMDSGFDAEVCKVSPMVVCE